MSLGTWVIYHFIVPKCQVGLLKIPQRCMKFLGQKLFNQHLQTLLNACWFPDFSRFSEFLKAKLKKRWVERTWFWASRNCGIWQTSLTYWKNQSPHLSPQKNGQKLSILKRLFNRDPNIGLLQSPQNWVVKSKKSPVYPKQLVVLVIVHLSLE